MKLLRIVFLFCLVAGFYSCQKETSIELANAKGSLNSDISDDCLPILVRGTYAKDTVLKDTNYVEIRVDVTETGSYVIKTETQNGYGFVGTGAFSNTGLQTVRLKGSGKPIAGGLNTFHVAFESDTCTFDIVVNGTGGGPTCTNTATDFVFGFIGANCTLLNTNIVADFDNTTLPGFSFLDISSENVAGDTTITFSLSVPASTIAPGSYNVNSMTYVMSADVTVPGDTYSAQTGGTNPTPVFTITITSLTATRVAGTWSGALNANSGAGPGNIQTNGAFDVPL